MSVENLPVSIIATGSSDRKTIVHRDGKSPQVLEGHNGAVYGVSFCPTNPDLLASASIDTTIILWDIKSNSNIKTLECPSFLYGVSWSCDGQYIAAACEDKKCYIFDAHNEYRQLCVLQGHTYHVWSVAFHPQYSAVCATASYDGAVRVWQLPSAGSQQPKCLKVLKHGGVARSCCWLPDGTYLVSGGEDRAVRLWNVEDGTEVTKFEDHRGWVFSVAASPDGRMIASGSSDYTCRIWEAKSGGKLLQVLNHPDAIRAVTFSGNGLVVTGCDDKKTRVWSIAVGKVVAELGGHTGDVLCVAVPPVGAGAAAASSSQPMSKTATVRSRKPNSSGVDDN